MSPRERFGEAVAALCSIIENTENAYRVVYIDAGSPAGISESLAALCAAHGFTHVRCEDMLSPNQARNLGLRHVTTPYVVFIDNDVFVAPGWLAALEACAAETGAEVVAPLTCQKLPLHSEIHQAGGSFTTDLPRFLAQPSAALMVEREHHLQGQKVADVALERGETQCCEFHCVLTRPPVVAAQGGLDEGLLATREHIDFSIGVLRAGGRLMFEPTSVVTYVIPGRASPITREDWAFFCLRWSPVWQKRSLERFAQKWGFEGEPYSRRMGKHLSWRLNMGVGRPVARRLPLIGRVAALEKAAAGVVTRGLALWTRLLAARHARRTPIIVGSKRIAGSRGIAVSAE